MVRITSTALAVLVAACVALSAQAQPSTIMGGPLAVCDGAIPVSSPVRAWHIVGVNDGSLLVGDGGFGVVRRVVPGVSEKVVAGTGNTVFNAAGYGGAATKMDLGQTNGVCIDQGGTVYVVQYQHVSQIDANGLIWPATSTGVGQPLGTAAGCATHGTRLIVADASLVQVPAYTIPCPNTGCAPPVALTSAGSALGDGGPATAAAMHANDIDIGADGTIYVADGSMARIRSITPDGIAHTVAGGGSGGDGPALSAVLYNPQGVRVAANGDVYVAEWGGSKIRRVRAGQITTVTTLGSASALALNPAQTMLFIGNQSPGVIQSLTLSAVSPPTATVTTTNTAVATNTATAAAFTPTQTLVPSFTVTASAVPTLTLPPTAPPCATVPALTHGTPGAGGQCTAP